MKRVVVEIAVSVEQIECKRCGKQQATVPSEVRRMRSPYEPSGPEGFFSSGWSYPDGWDRIDGKMICNECVDDVREAIDHCLRDQGLDPQRPE